MNIKLDLHINAVNTILAGLSKLPWEQANPVIIEVQKQTQEQLKPQGVASAPEASNG